MNKILLKLYITGQTPGLERAIADLRRICDTKFDSKYKLVVINILEHPQLAMNDKVLATPTVIKELPLPIRRIVGDLSDKEKVLLGLELQYTE